MRVQIYYIIYHSFTGDQTKIPVLSIKKQHLLRNIKPSQAS